MSERPKQVEVFEMALYPDKTLQLTYNPPIAATPNSFSTGRDPFFEVRILNHQSEQWIQVALSTRELEALAQAARRFILWGNHENTEKLGGE